MSPSDGRPRPGLALGVVALFTAAFLQTGGALSGPPDARPWPPPRPSVSDTQQRVCDARQPVPDIRQSASGTGQPVCDTRQPMCGSPQPVSGILRVAPDRQWPPPQPVETAVYLSGLR